MKTLYTTNATTVGGRNGHTETDNKSLVLNLATPGAPNAKPGTTNPEQLFACAYSACFGGAVDLVARKHKVDASKASITAEIKLLQEESGGYRIGAALEVRIPGVEKSEGQKIVDEAHQVCPYSKATRGNVDVKVTFVA
jgi:Ohr subfamily peroxiredoxin